MLTVGKARESDEGYVRQKSSNNIGVGDGALFHITRRLRLR